MGLRRCQHLLGSGTIVSFAKAFRRSGLPTEIRAADGTVVERLEL